MMRIHKSQYFYSKRSPRSPNYSKNGWFHRTLDKVRLSSNSARTNPPFSGVVVPRFSYDVKTTPAVPIMGPPQEPATSKQPLSPVRVFFQKQKDWIKLNVAYLIGTGVGTAAAYINSSAARRMGVDPTTAATLVASVSQYAFGISAVCASWFFLQKEKYTSNAKKWLSDSFKIVGSTILAQGITWAATWPMTAVAIGFGASNALAVTLQTQVFDRLVYIPLFNFFNRKRVKEMKEFSAKSDADS